MKQTLSLLIGGLCFFACSPTGVKQSTIGGLSPQQALETFEVADGFKLEQIAAEPLVADPVAMEIDEFGRMYVVEMHGYPLDKSGSGAVKLLSDSDGDGIMDKSTIFADDLVLPTGVMRWKKGIIVTDPPNVLYLEDTDNDGKADKREVILTGFALANPQHNVNNPIMGLDNWVYLGHEPAATAQVYTDHYSDRGSPVHYPNRPNSQSLPENALGRSVRFNPSKGMLENLSSQTQFGHSFNQWGQRFLVSNAHHIYHEVFGARYLNRNNSLLVSNTIESISDHGNAADVYPITKNPQHQLLTDLGVFTAACGITAYTGGAFPSEFNNVTFVAEPVGNLVHADILTDNGPSYKASRVYEKKEFLASTDPWFRPANMYVGPDGALYIIDYYRQIIEHPEWMADDIGKSEMVYNGKDQGRIYRVSTIDGKKQDWTKGLDLGNQTTEQLIAHLSSENSWWRKNAQRLLVDQNDPKAIPLLEIVAKSGENELGRLHALWTLHGLDALSAETLIAGIKDKSAGVRENAIRMSEDLYLMTPNENTNKVVDALITLKADPSERVRFQVLASLGFIDTPVAQATRKSILFANLGNKWMQLAALSAKNVDSDKLLEEVIRLSRNGQTDKYAALAERLSNMVGTTGDISKIKLLINNVFSKANVEQDWRSSVIKGLTQSLRRTGADPMHFTAEKDLLLQVFLESKEGSMRSASVELLRLFGLPQGSTATNALAKALETSKNKNSSEEQRKEAISLLVLDGAAKHQELFKSLVVATEPIPVQAAALHAINAIPDNTVAHFLVEKWSSLTPGLREQAIGTFMANNDRITLLLDALEKKIIDPTVISWPRQVGLMANGNEPLRLRARQLLSGSNSSEQESIKSFQESLTLTGNPANGKAVFEQQCAICHQIGGKMGVFFGPDLASIRTRRPESVMADILNPNLSIADGYDIWNVELKSGETLQGLIASETPSAITLRNYGGAETIVARGDIQELKAMGTSVMTAGFDKLVSKQEMADLLAFLRQAH